MSCGCCSDRRRLEGTRPRSRDGRSAPRIRGSSLSCLREREAAPPPAPAPLPGKGVCGLEAEEEASKSREDAITRDRGDLRQPTPGSTATPYPPLQRRAPSFSRKSPPQISTKECPQFPTWEPTRAPRSLEVFSLSNFEPRLCDYRLCRKTWGGRLKQRPLKNVQVSENRDPCSDDGALSIQNS